MIVADPRNPRAQEIRAGLEHRLAEDDHRDIIVVIGGDGFFLHTVSEHGLDARYLGLNAGHLGFLLNDVDDDWEALATLFRERRWRALRFPLLEAEIRTLDGRTVRGWAINDVYLERMTGQTGRYRLHVDDQLVVEQMVADGMIFATALGSTAYSFSAGGSPSHPTLRTLHVTPICPHQPKLNPFVLPDTARARVEVIAPDRRPVRAVVDGRGVERVLGVSVAYSSRSACFLYFDRHDFTRQMLAKIVQR